MRQINKGLLFWAFGIILLITLSANVTAQSGWMPEQRGEAGKDLTAVYFIDSKRGFVGGEEGRLIYTEDGGASWSKKTLPTEHTINDVYFRNKEIGFVLAGNTIFTSDDSGITWHELQNFMPSDFKGAMPELYSIRFGSKKNGWIVGSLGKKNTVVDSLFLYTEDGGTTWFRRSLPTQKELVHLDFVSDERGWVVGADGTILFTEDAGVTWSVQRSGVTAMLNNVDFQGKKKGWAVGQKGTLLRTTDGGITWVSVTVPVNGALYSVKFINDDNGWIVGRNGTILLSNDGGKTWIQQDSKTKQHLYALYMDKKIGCAVGSDGVLVQYIK